MARGYVNSETYVEKPKDKYRAAITEKRADRCRYEWPKIERLRTRWPSLYPYYGVRPGVKLAFSCPIYIDTTVALCLFSFCFVNVFLEYT